MLKHMRKASYIGFLGDPTHSECPLSADVLRRIYCLTRDFERPLNINSSSKQNVLEYSQPILLFASSQALKAIKIPLFSVRYTH